LVLAKAKKSVSPQGHFRKWTADHGVEQRPVVQRTVDGPGDLDHRADGALPRVVELAHELARPGQRRRTAPGSASPTRGGLQTQGSLEEAVGGQAEHGNALFPRVERRRIERLQRTVVLG